MKTPRIVAFLAIFVSLPAFAAWDGRVYRVGTGEVIPFETLRTELATSPQVVLGEKHLTATVQAEQARVILGAAQASGRHAQVAWEFLDYRDHDKVAALYASFLNGQTTALDLLRSYFGSAQYGTYAPILDAAKELGAGLVPTNLSRDEKAPVVQGGLAAADPALVPPGFELGDAAYYDRFKDAIGGHGTPEQLGNYFAAQCLTDDVMALHFTALPREDIRFLVTGSFHADFRDGAVRRIGLRSTTQAVRTVRFYDASDYTAAELEAGFRDLLVDPKFGAVGDYVLFVGEPR